MNKRGKVCDMSNSLAGATPTMAEVNASRRRGLTTRQTMPSGANPLDGIGTYTAADAATSVLRWMGSKRRHAQFLGSVIRTALTGVGTYFEPFLGSGAVALAVNAERSVLGDLNGDLMNAWNVLRSRPKDLHAAVAAHPPDKTTYYRLRSEYGNDPFEQAVRFVYLNRYCFNGIYRTNRLNEFNVPYGNATGALPPEEMFVACARVLASATLVNSDFEDTLKSAREGDVVYLDPPYPASRPTYGEYGYGSFNGEDMHRLQECVECLTRLGVSVFLSLPISRTHSSFGILTRHVVPMRYSVASKSQHRRAETVALMANPVAQRAIRCSRVSER